MLKPQNVFVNVLMKYGGGDSNHALRGPIVEGFKNFALSHPEPAIEDLGGGPQSDNNICGWWLLKVRNEMLSELAFIQDQNTAEEFFSRGSAIKNKREKIFLIFYWLYVHCEDDRYARAIEKSAFPKGSFEAQFGVSVPKTSEDTEILFGVLEGEDDSTHQSTNHKWLQPKRLRLPATGATALLVAATISLVIGWPRDQTNLFLFEIASKILPFHNTMQEFISGLNYERDPEGLIENVRAQTGMALLHELYNRNSSLAAGMLGSRYSHGSFVKRDTEKALQYLHFAEQADDPRALGVLAHMLTDEDRINSIERTDEEVFEHSNELLKRAIEVDVTPQTKLAISAAQNSLGWRYQIGRGVPQDFNKAVELFTLAIENGSVLAINNLGTMYAAGLGVPENVSKAIELYKRAYEEGNEYGLINLAYTFADGIDPEKGYREAAKLYEEGKDRGIAWATTQYAYLLETGKLPGEEGKGFQSADPAKAEMLYLTSASEGDPGSMWHLGQLYESDKLGETNLDGAKHWYGKLEQEDEPYYLRLLGEHYLNVGYIPERVKKAIEVLQKAEQAGSALASYKLGELFLSSSTIRYSGEDAAEKFRKGMARGSVEAQLSYGELLLDPYTPPNDAIYGKRLILAAAAQKTPWIMNRAANILLGVSDEADLETALRLLHDAAEQGYGWSRRVLVQVYGSGEIVEIDINLAREQLDLLIDNQHSAVLSSMLSYGPLSWKDIIPGSLSTIDKHSCGRSSWFHCFNFDQSEWVTKLREIAALDIPRARALLILHYADVEQCGDAEREFGLLKFDADRDIIQAQVAVVELGAAIDQKKAWGGCDVVIDEDEAERYLLVAAASSNNDAIWKILQFAPWPDFVKDSAVNSAWLKLLEEKAIQSGNSDLWELLGDIFETLNLPWKAEIWYRKAVEGGQPYVAERLADLYSESFSPPRVEDAIAVARKYMEPDEAHAYLLYLRGKEGVIPTLGDTRQGAIGDLDTETAQ